MSNPFRYFNSSPEVIRLAVMMYVRYPLSLRNVEDLPAERGIDLSHETVRFWWNRFGRLRCSDERCRQRRSPGGRPRAQQSRGELASAVSTTRARHAALSKYEDVAEIQLSSRPDPQPFQSRAPSGHPPSLQAETLCHIGRMARPRGLNLACGARVAPRALTTRRYPDKSPTPCWSANFLAYRS